MIAYLDSSAIIPIIISEPSSELCRRIWSDADQLLSSQLSYVEVAAALAMAERQGRITSDEFEHAWADFTLRWAEVGVIAVSAGFVVRAARVARSHALRGYDAVHCTMALALNDADLVAVSGDKELLRAWDELGVATADTNRAR
ncbi:type II toxin-antitoxin system VapC family toxin [Propionimicrobium sp. PCR01-08-3]|uniref:type II toxin-antitoxin system VapC family toxin n=1 Tax=Propionimicrobium sp. PCR01-08-3 TaxID=3052086 RepID=UPI00255C341A|nr:type II toxin-antitoxin system VapC family toxin [Propionimicrobium sp. PCR01-08-3]WIY83856.1 type II toxin-antitoxin system VapC family toxin [Propionimicrobium sp. PCR01-08-3]